jgi:hypothetical protein
VLDPLDLEAVEQAEKTPQKEADDATHIAAGWAGFATAMCRDRVRQPQRR